MLVEFSVKNFLSIEKKATLSLLASTDKLLPENVIKTESLGKDELLKTAVLYGANASGKTNVIYAFNQLVKLVRDSHKFQKGDLIDHYPFKFNEETFKQPTEFEIVFIKNKIKYVYSLSYDKNSIHNESLYYYPKGRKAMIFNRSPTRYAFTKHKSKQNRISSNTLPNVLYLSKATQSNYEPVSEAFDWFKYDVWMIGPTNQQWLKEFTFIKMMENKDFKEVVLKALKYADTGIDAIEGNVQKIEFDEMPEYFPKILKKEASNKDVVKFVELRKSISTFHKDVLLDFSEESDGTRRLYYLIGPWIDALLNGKILIVDELDTKLHHLLSSLLINLFHDPSKNKTNAQLIFTTHDLNLLDRHLFRRDQIWFTEKVPETQSTELYSLVQYKPRNDTNYLNGYLSGRYGGIPYIKSLKVF